MTTDTDIALIGAGPLGIEMAAALQRASLSYAHLEANQIGATMQWWSPGTRWFSSNDRIGIAGVPLTTPFQEKATREEYLAYLRAIVTQFNLNIHTYTRVTAIERAGPKFLLRARRNVRGLLMGDELLWHANKIILSTGGTERPNLLNIPGEDLPHVSHYFSDPHSYFNRDVVIVGGRNSAVEAALRCHRVGARVHFVYRRESVDAKDIKYWLHPEFSSLLKSGTDGGIVGHFHSTPIEITPDAVRLRHSQTNDTKLIPADFVLLMTGYVADMTLAKMAGVQLAADHDVPLFNPETMQTNTPGVYIIGTAIAGTQHRYKVFLENCHVHVDRVLSHLLGRNDHIAEPQFDRPES